MAVFGNNAQQGLQLTVSERGAQETAGKLNAVAVSADRVARSAGTGAASGVGRLRQGLSGLRNMANGLIGTFARVGGILGIGGGIAIMGLLKETSDVERALSQIAWQSGKSAEQMERMRDAARSASGETGKTKAEILAAMLQAEDLGMTFEQVEKHMKQLVLWSDLLQVDPGAAAGAVGGVNKALGGNADINQVMAMLNAGALNSGMDESDFFGIVSKVAPQLQGVENAGDVTSFMQVLAGLGGAFAQDTGSIVKGMKALNRGMNDSKTRKAWEKAGVWGDNASEILMNIAGKLATDRNAFENAGLDDQVLVLANSMADNIGQMEKMGAAVSAAGGNAEAFAAKVAAHSDDPAIAFAAMKEKLKNAFDPLAKSVLGWLAANSDKIVAGLQAFMGALSTAAGALPAIGETLGQGLYELLNGTPQVNDAMTMEGPRREGENFLDYLQRVQTRIDTTGNGPVAGMGPGATPWTQTVGSEGGAVANAFGAMVNRGAAPAAPPQRTQLQVTINNNNDSAVDVRRDARAQAAI
jgi:hypothetical protein